MKIPGFTAEAALNETGEHYRIAAIPNNQVGSRGVLPQLRSQDDTTWTTDKVCKACGCTVKGFGCDCGTPPSRTKLECIQNGGPGKAMPVAMSVRSVMAERLRGFGLTLGV
jgi:hypothetical protein